MPLIKYPYVELPLSLRKEHDSSHWQLVDALDKIILDKLPSLYDAWSIVSLCNKFKDFQNVDIALIRNLYVSYKEMTLVELDDHIQMCINDLTNLPDSKADTYRKLIILVFIHARKNNINLIGEFCQC